MASIKSDEKPRGRKPAASPQDYEDRLINLAMKQAEKQLVKGTASNQVITHFLKLASSREQLEQGLLAERTKLVGAQTSAVESSQRGEELLTEAVAAFRVYSGQVDESDE